MDIQLDQELLELAGQKEAVAVFTNTQVVSNLEIVTVTVPAASVKMITDTVELDKESQREIVFDLVDANAKGFNKLEEKEAQAQIFVRLTQETVVQYLAAEEIINDCQQYHPYFLEDGTLIVEAFYFLNEEGFREYKHFIKKDKAQHNGIPSKEQLKKMKKQNKKVVAV